MNIDSNKNLIDTNSNKLNLDYNVSQINKQKNENNLNLIDTNILNINSNKYLIDNNIASIQNINSKLSKYSINYIFLYQISKEENFELNNNNNPISKISNYELIDNFKKDSI